ncbi:MAG: YqiA/YcfP family alpha/beta fold hydrolase [Thiohalophilus sp.]|jgi:hypothetical protein
MIIYLHGFNSSGASAKGQFLREHLDDITVLTPSYYYNPTRTVAMLRELIEQSLRLDNNLLLAGSSLGGFYTQYLAREYSLKNVLINPALLPLDTLENYLGENVNYYTGERYILNREHLAALEALDVPQPCESALPTLLLLDKGDEVLDYRVALGRYHDCAKICLFEDGDHAFQHMPDSLPAIRELHDRPWSGSGTD